MQQRSRNIPWILTALILLLLLVAGCAGIQNAPPVTRYYTLAYPAPQVGDRQPLPALLRVEEFQVDPAFDTTKMVYSGTPLRVKYYHYHRWYAHPGILCAAFVQRDLRRSELFKGVFSAHHGYDVTHLVTGSVDSFYEHDGPHGWEARLSLTIAFLTADGSDPAQQVIFQNNYQAVVKSDEKTPESVAAAMSQAMQQVSGALLKDIYEAVATTTE